MNRQLLGYATFFFFLTAGVSTVVTSVLVWKIIAAGLAALSTGALP